MTARSTYDTSVANANIARANTLSLNEMQRQVALDAKRTIVGYNNATGDNVALLSATASSNATKASSDAAAYVQHQQTVMQAKDTLKNSGDVNPA
jgi:hypothetical protein